MIDEKLLMEKLREAAISHGKHTWTGNYFSTIADYVESRIKLMPKVGEWKRTAEEKPDYTRHVIITYGSSRHASKYGYYFKKEDKWYRDHRCLEEIEQPYAWIEMPEVPEEFVCGVCCG